MPGFILHEGAEVLCAHGGQAEPMVPMPRVLVSAMPVVTQASPYAIAGCAFPPPPAANGPCVTAMWTVAATRVFAMGLPVLVSSGVATCVPTGTPLVVSVTQTRVSAL